MNYLSSAFGWLTGAGQADEPPQQESPELTEEEIRESRLRHLSQRLQRASSAPEPEPVAAGAAASSSSSSKASKATKRPQKKKKQQSKRKSSVDAPKAQQAAQAAQTVQEAPQVPQSQPVQPPQPTRVTTKPPKKKRRYKPVTQLPGSAPSSGSTTPTAVASAHPPESDDSEDEEMEQAWMDPDEAVDAFEVWQDSVIRTVLCVHVPGAPRTSSSSVEISSLSDASSRVFLSMDNIDMVLLERIGMFSKPSTERLSPLSYMIECYERLNKQREQLEQRSQPQSQPHEQPPLLAKQRLALNDMSRVIVSFASMCLDESEAEVFAEDAENRVYTASQADLKRLLRSRPGLGRTVPDNFMADLLAHVDEERLEQLVVPLLHYALGTARLGEAGQLPFSAESLSSWRLRFVAKLAAHRPVASWLAALTDDARLNRPPAGSETRIAPLFPAAGLFGRQVQNFSLLGPVLGIGCPPGEAAFQGFLTRTQGLGERGPMAGPVVIAIDETTRRWRGELRTLQDETAQLLKVVLKASPLARERFLDFQALQLRLNQDRTKMQYDRSIVATDPYVLNLASVLVRLCKPLFDQRSKGSKRDALGLLDVRGYYASPCGGQAGAPEGNPRLPGPSVRDAPKKLGFAQAELLAEEANQEAAREEALLQQQQEEDEDEPMDGSGNAQGRRRFQRMGRLRKQRSRERQAQRGTATPPFNYWTEMVFQTAEWLHVSVIPKLQHQRQIEEQAARLRREHMQFMQSNGNRPDPMFMQRHDMYMAAMLAGRVQLSDGEFLRDVTNFYDWLSGWILQLINAHEQQLESGPLDPLRSLLCVPEFVLEDILACFSFAASQPGHRRDDFTDKFRTDNLLELMIKLSAGKFKAANPHTNDHIVRILHSWLPDPPSRDDGYDAVYLSRSHAFVQLASGANSDDGGGLIPALLELYIAKHVPYLKHQIRHNIGEIFQVLWNVPAQRAVFARMLQQATQDGDTEEEGVLPFVARGSLPYRMLRFVHFAVGSMSHLLEEGLLGLANVHELEQLQAVHPETGEPNAEWAEMDAAARREREERARESGQRARACLTLSQSILRLLVLMTDDARGGVSHAFAGNPVVAHELSSALVFFVKQLNSRKAAQTLKVKNRDKYNFAPKRLLRDIAHVLLNCTRAHPSFAKAIVASQLYTDEVFQRTDKFVHKYKLLRAPEAERFSQVCADLRVHKVRHDLLEAKLADAPEEFLDMLMFEVMRDPILLPGDVRIDRSTLLRHFLDDDGRTNPFTKAPLSDDDMRPDTELKAKIDEFLEGVEREVAAEVGE